MGARVSAPWPRASNLEARELCCGEIAKSRTRRSEPVAILVAHEIAVEPEIMGDNDVAIAREMDVELDAVRSERHSVRKSGERIFGRKRGAAAMGDHENWHGRHQRTPRGSAKRILAVLGMATREL
jgi:hypothetical protein